MGDTTQADYDKYVTACSDKGFTIDYDKGEKYYSADNADGYHLSLSYEGNNIMLVSVDEPDEEDSSSKKETSRKKEASSTAKPKKSVADSTTVSNSSSVKKDGLRADFKEAMDSYETFMNEYCEFMKKYNKNSSDASLLADYASYMAKYTDFVERFDAWKNEDMNDAELAYYLKVQSRVTTKLAEVAQ